MSADVKGSAAGKTGTREFVTRDGTALQVVEEGPPDAPVTVVLVHGWTLTSRTWDRVAAELPGTTGGTARVLRFDLRGHGGSAPAPEGSATIRQCADDLAELIDERVPEGPVVLAGHSMGGMTIMALAERSPELFGQRIAAVALVATSSGDLAHPTLGLPRPLAALGGAVERRVRARLSSARGARLSRRPRLLRPGLRWLLFGAGPSKVDLDAAAGWVAACHPASMAGFRTSLAEHERAGALEVLRRVPTVVLAGLADRLCPFPHSRRIADAVPEAQLLVYAGAGHMLPVERAGEVSARLAELVRVAVG